jgi:group I intron endonuclease
MPYKEIISGIYKIQSKIKPERIYIGSAVNVFKRWSDHRRLLNKNKHHSPQLQRHYNKYGLSDLDFEIIESENYIDNKQLLAREQTWIFRFHYDNTWKPFFNVNEVAGNRKGAILSKSTLKKMSKSLTGIKWKDEDRDRRIASMKGIKRSEETCKRMSEAQRGNKKGVGKIPWNKGMVGYYKFSDEECQKRKERATGKNNPNFGKTPWNKGKKGSQKAWNKGLKGPKQSQETIQKRLGSRKKNLTLKQQNNSI